MTLRNQNMYTSRNGFRTEVVLERNGTRFDVTVRSYSLASGRLHGEGHTHTFATQAEAERWHDDVVNRVRL